MAENNQTSVIVRWLRIKIPSFFARSLGVGDERKTALFLDLSRAATLLDIVYWLQIFFAAGIATLGLVLNSPAVIIGAMLISPLMNPILSSGLALATGDIVLGLRAFFSLLLSCAAAISFAVVLVTLLPFREMTAEIAARTQPNVLDLTIAIFSGAVGAVAICREVKGVVTSIPGVAIAVALMPPLCVVGYGIGLAMVFDTETGWRVAGGGGLLFLTNLVAITLMAMCVFLALRIDTPAVREKVEEWEQNDPESRFVIRRLRHFPGLEHARQIHSLTLRLLMILVPLGLILVPLYSSFQQLKTELVQKQQDSRMRSLITDVWQERFQKKSDGVSRSTIDQLSVQEKDDKLNISLRVFDDQPYTLAEKKECAELIAGQLHRPVESINLQLTEIPTVSVLEAIRQKTEDKPLPPPSIAELQSNLLERVELALSDFQLPAPAVMLRKQIVTGTVTPLELKIVYLSDERIDAATEMSLLEKVRKNLNDDRTTISLERVPASLGDLPFDRGRPAALSLPAMLQLDFAGRLLRENPTLTLVVGDTRRAGDIPDSGAKRMQLITGYLETHWQIAPGRLKQVEAPAAGQMLLTLQDKTNKTDLPESPK